MNRETRILWTTTLVMLTALTALPAQAASPEAPRLVVGITVDQLRSDYLNALEARLGEDGLRRLLRQGVVYDQVTFELDRPDAIAAMAVLATGSYPYENGVVAQRVFDLKTLQRHSVFYDNQYIGYNTNDCWSPRGLLSSTLADELMVTSGNRSHIYSIAAEAEQAIIGAGHSANGAFWIDDKTGQWASTTYYHDFPPFVQRLNTGGQPLFCDADNQTWTCSSTEAEALAIMPHRKVLPYFSHSFRKGGQTQYAALKTTPVVNSAIVELAKQFITTYQLGQSDNTDMLQLAFYAGTYLHDKTEVYPSELQDTYLQLDKTLGELFDFIDKKIGLSRTVIYLTGTGNTNTNATEIPGLSLGEFNANRCTALLNSHLCSLHGSAQWVEGFDGDAIYLNHKTIEQHQLQVNTVAREAAEFVALFSGVGEVYTQRQLLHEAYTTRIVRKRNGYHKQIGGDIIVVLQSGWNMRLSDLHSAQPQARYDVTPGPFILFAPSAVTPQRFTTPIEAVHVAPTVARTLRIRAPSACQATALF